MRKIKFRYILAASIAGLIALIIFFAGYIPATNPYRVRQAQVVVADSLVDPSSAKFKGVAVSRPDLTLKPPQHWVCGQVNAKNRMNAYVGFTPFMVREDGENLSMFPNDAVSEEDTKAADNECNTNSYACDRASEMHRKRLATLQWQISYLESCRTK